MNAIPPSPPEPARAARTACHLAMLQELAEIGMALARAIGRQALAALNAPDPETQAAAQPDPAPPTPIRTDPGLAFARISRAVRQTIALEARILADRDAPPRPPRPDRNADPRRATIRRVLREAARADAGGIAPAAHLLREIDERLDDGLDADPGQDIPVEEIIAGICEDLGLGRDLARQSDELIEALILAGPDRAAADDPASDPDPPAERPVRPPPPSASPPSGPDPP